MEVGKGGLQVGTNGAAKGPVFDLEPGVAFGEVPEATLDELVVRCAAAKHAASDFTEAIKRQATKYGVKKGALSRLVRARTGDKVDKLRLETESLTKLLER